MEGLIEIIRKQGNEQARDILVDIMSVYLDKGFGVMNKTDIETLFYYVLRQHGLLSGRCFDDSFTLQISEAKARKLIYDSQVKYGTRDKDQLDTYLRKSVGECLTHAFFSKNNKEIRFAIEDKYLRVALNAKLRDNHYFADTSFNKDIVSLDEDAFRELILLLVPNFSREEVLARLTELELDEKAKQEADLKAFMREVVKGLMTQGTTSALIQLGKWLMTAG